MDIALIILNYKNQELFYSYSLYESRNLTKLLIVYSRELNSKG